jgi:hypothetical protein
MAQLGREPSPRETTLIERIAMVRLHITLIDERWAAERIVPSAHDMRSYSALNSQLVSFERQLDRLRTGKAALAPPKPDPHAYLEALRERAGAAA